MLSCLVIVAIMSQVAVGAGGRTMVLSVSVWRRVFLLADIPSLASYGIPTNPRLPAGSSASGSIPNNSNGRNRKHLTTLFKEEMEM